VTLAAVVALERSVMWILVILIVLLLIARRL